MFGLIAAGRMVQTDFEQVELTKCIINIVDVSEINHVVVFLTGVQAFPEGYGGQIYLNLPDLSNSNAPCWSLLGHITNAKPSAIFKISNLKKSEQVDSVSSRFFNASIPNINNSLHAQVGISFELLSDIEQSTPVTAATPSNISTFNEFAGKTLENFMNYVCSFNSDTTGYIPISVAKSWYDNFNRRLQANPFFWRS